MKVIVLKNNPFDSNPSLFQSLHKRFKGFMMDFTIYFFSFLFKLNYSHVYTDGIL